MGEFAADGFVESSRFHVDQFSVSKFVARVVPVLSEEVF